MIEHSPLLLKLRCDPVIATILGMPYEKLRPFSLLQILLKGELYEAQIPWVLSSSVASHLGIIRETNAPLQDSLRGLIPYAMLPRATEQKSYGAQIVMRDALEKLCIPYCSPH